MSKLPPIITSPKEHLNRISHERAKSKEVSTRRANLDPKLFKVSKDCFACSGDSKEHILQAIKMACLVYTEGNIDYSNNKYHVDDLLEVKASVISDCQRKVRERMYGKDSYGKDIKNIQTEKSFVIEPLLKAKSVTHTHHETVNLFKSVAIKPDDSIKLNDSVKLSRPNYVSPRKAKRVKSTLREVRDG